MAQQLFCGIARNRYQGFSYTNPKGEKKHANTVQQKITSWSTLAARLRQLHTVKEKHKGPYMVFAKFKETSPENGEYRRVNDNIEAFYGAVLDVDLPDVPTFDDTHGRLIDLGLNYVLYTTHSYDPLSETAANKYRVVVPYDKPVDPHQHALAVTGLAVLLGLEGSVDAASTVWSQPMYCHAAPHERAGEAMAESCINGVGLDVEQALALGELWLIDQGLSGGRGVGGGRGPVPERNTSLVAGERHPTFARHIAKCKREGMSWEQTLGELVIWNGSLDEPLPRDELEKMVSVWEGFERNDNAFGFEEHKARIMNAPVMDRETYKSILRHIANSETMLDASDRKELFGMIKLQRPGATLRLIEDEYRRQLLGVRQITDNKLDAEKAKLAQRLLVELDGYVWLTDLGMAYHLSTGKYIKKEAFQSMLTHLWGRIGGEFIGLATAFKSSPLTLNNLLVEHWVPVYNDIGFNPGMGDAYSDYGGTLCNTYVPPRHLVGDGSEGVVAPLLEYFEFLFPDLDDCKLMLDFIAGMVQQPGRKIRYTPVVYTAVEQIGKDFLKENLLKPLLGPRNVGEVDGSYVREKYTENLTGKQLVMLQELDFGRDRRLAETTANKMKPFITNTEVQLRRFGMAAGATVHHCANYIAFTNYFDAVFMEGAGKRYYLIKGPNKPKRPQWYHRMAAWFDDHIEDCYEYFKARDLGDFSFDRAPVNRHTEHMRQLSARWPLGLLNEAAQEGLFRNITHLPLHWLVELIKKLSPPDDFEGHDRAGRLLGGGRSREREFVLEELQKYGYEVLNQLLNFDRPGKRGRKGRCKQVVIQFPGCYVKGELFQQCKDSVKALEALRMDEDGMIWDDSEDLLK